MVKRIALVSLGLLIACGCSRREPGAPGAESGRAPSGSPAAAAPPAREIAPASAHAGAAPVEIVELTDQTEVWDCPKCGMEFDRAGMCTMDNVELVRTHVAYVCPADKRPVPRAGRCPRCAMDARIQRTAMTAQLQLPNAGGP